MHRILLKPGAMARIQSRFDRNGLRVLIKGRLTATDMGRLERACAAALTRHPLQLALDLRRVTAIDATAAAVLRRLCDRGAVVKRSLPILSTY